ncbi:metallophosphoesterase [Sandaracinus amylolyticus]|uniref:Purple acid phosphatase n=1 Tax=Sandaracinus amylolyticus TaxID=927083 RepID=A0A0F6W3F3_9BACT|nr:metallophosphoesterase [Sandaracinus amylolyticus]AKF06296.1 Purple acid phosphatase [Sandaracinus amylolyticus]
MTGCGGGDQGVSPFDAGTPLLGPDAGRVDAGRVDAGRDDGGRGEEVDAGGGGPDAGPPPPDDLRFVVMGDTGEGNEGQRAVAVAIRDLCAREGCDFVVLLGDNIYEVGVTSVDDAQWQSKFEEPYRDIDLPFYAVLGNHDYGGAIIPGSGDQWDRGPIEVEYSAHSDRWRMPGTHYTLRFGNVGFVMLDTNSIFYNDARYGDQAGWYDGAVDELREEGAEWILVAGHHPYRSNGSHGNAGNYESRIGIPNLIPPINGANVQRFFDDHVCGTADVYFAGHDHNRQWIDEPEALCGTTMIVSGAGAKLTAFAREDNTTLFQDDQREGFLYVVIEGDRFVGRFVDRDGRTDFEHTVTRTSR